MTTTEQQLLEALKKLEAAVAGINSQPKPDLMTHFDRIDALAAELPDGTDGELLHYLHKKGYQKARLYLEGRFSEIEKEQEIQHMGEDHAAGCTETKRNHSQREDGQRVRFQEFLALHRGPHDQAEEDRDDVDEGSARSAAQALGHAGLSNQVAEHQHAD